MGNQEDPNGRTQGIGPARRLLRVAVPCAALAATWVLVPGWCADPVSHSAVACAHTVARSGWGFLLIAAVLLSVVLHACTETGPRSGADPGSDQTHALLIAVAEGTTDAVYVKDTSGRYLLFNAAAARMVGKPAADVLGHDDTSLFPPNEARVIMEGDRRIIEEAIVRTYEEQATLGGQVLTFLSTKGPVRDAEGRVIGLFGIARDITERRAQERHLEQVSRLNAVLSQVNQYAIKPRADAEPLAEACRSLVEAGGLRHAWAGVLDPSTQGVSRVTRFGEPAGDEEMADEESVVARCLREGQTVVGRGGAVAALPILRSGRLFGVLVACAPAEEFFAKEETSLVEELARDISSVLDHLEDERRRRTAEESARATHMLMVSIIEFLPDATFVIDQQKRVVAWNRACEALTGVPKEAILGKEDYAYAEPFFGERRPILIDLLDFSDAELEATYKYVRRSGELITAESFIGRMHGGAGAHLWGVAAPLYDHEGRRCGAVEVVRDVTEQTRVQRALLESELKHRMLFEAAGDAIFLMRGERFIECNPRTLAMFGCTRDEIIGAPPYAFSPPNQPNGRPSVECARGWILKAQTEGPQAFEWLHCRRDGTPFFAEVSLNRLELGGEVLIQAIVRDICDRKRAEERLAESERRYRELVEFANSIILRWSADGIITFVNEFGQRFFGYTAEEMCGRHVMDTIVPQTESTGRDLRDLMDRILADPRAFEQNVNENIRRNGERAWIAWTNRIVLGPDGRVAEILSIGTDITQQRRAEEEIRRLHADLQRHASELERRVAERTAELAVARDRAEEADRLKSAFLATMSHELRTPLNSIIGFSGVLLQGLAGPLNEEQAKQLSMVRSSARHLLALINDVLDLSKIEAGQLRVSREPFSLPDSISKVIGMVEPMAHQKGLSLQVTVAPEVTMVVSDARRVEQVILNLLNNAVKFTEQGAVALAAEAVPAGASEEGGSESVRIAVSDTGAGIRPEDLPTLFRPFHQLDTGLSRRHEGTGLGLAICRRLLDALGGRVEVTSELGVGSVFTVTLPVKGPRVTA